MRLMQTARIAAVFMLFWILVGICLAGMTDGHSAKAAGTRIEEEIEIPEYDIFTEYGDLEIAAGGMLCVSGALEMGSGSKLTVRQGGRLKLCSAIMDYFAAELVVEGLVEIENCEWDNPNIKITVKKTGVLRLVNSTLKTLASPIILDGGRLEITRTAGNSYVISSGCYAIEAKNSASIYIGGSCEIRRMQSAAEKAAGGRFDKVVLLQAGCPFYTDGLSYLFNKDAYLSGQNKSGGADVWNRIRDIHIAAAPEEFDARRTDNDQSLLYLSTTLDLYIINNDGLGGSNGIKTYNKQVMQADAAISNPQSGTTYLYKWYRAVDGIMQQLINTSPTLTIKDTADSGRYKCAICDGGKTVDECEITLTILPKAVSLKWTGVNPIYNGAFCQPFAEVANIEDGDECSVAVSGGGIAAGSYTVKAVSISNDNYILPEAVECGLVIAPKPVSSFAVAGSYHYSGLPQNIAVICAETSEDYTLTLVGADNIIDAGSYEVEVVGISNGNYAVTAPVVLTLTILPRQLTYTIGGGNTSVYGEQVQSGDLLQGRLSSDLKEAVPGEAGIYLYIEGNPEQGASAGKYRIKGGWSNLQNYYVAFEEADYCITPREIEVFYGDIGNFVFDNNRHYIDVFISNMYEGDSINLLYEASNKNVSYSGGRVSAIMPGSYSIDFTAVENNNNYTIKKAQPLRFSIAKATVGIAFEGVDNLIYNGLPKAVVAIPKDTISGIDCSLKTVLKSGGAAAANAVAAGYYTLTAVGFDTLDGQHECYTLPDTGLQISFEIVQAVVGIRFGNYSNLIYNGNTHNIVAEATGIFGEDAVGLVINGATAKEAGSYKAAVVGLDNANYKLPDEGCSITYTVNKCRLIAAICNASSVYGESIAPLEYNIIGKHIAGDDLGISLSKAMGSGAGSYDIIGSWNGNKNYCLTFTCGDNAYTVQKRRLTLSVDEKSSVYGDGKEPLSYTIISGSVVADDDIGVVFEVERQDSFAAGTAGIYNITAAASNANYEVTVNQAAYTVLPRRIRVEIDKAYKVYGEPDPTFTAAIFNGLPGDDIQIGLYSSGIKAGVYDIFAVCGNLNYIIAESNGNNAFFIAPKELTISFANYQGLSYNGTPYAIAVTAGGVMDGDTVELELAGNNNIDAGSYCISVTGFAQGGKDNDNYKLPAITPCQAYTIAPKNLELGFKGAQDGVYNGKAAEISVFAIGQIEGDTVEIEYIIYNTSNSAKQIAAQVKNAGCYEAEIVSIKASANYNIPALISKSFVIAPAPIKYIIDNQTGVFGDPIPTLTGKVADGYTVFENDGLGIRLCTSGKDAGRYAITGIAGNPNYKVSFVTATYTVAQRELGLTFCGHSINGQDRVYKNTLLDIYIDVYNAVLGDNIYFDPTQITLTRNGQLAEILSYNINSICIADFAGDYVLRIDGLPIGDNYCFSPTQLCYTVQRRQLTVSFAGCDGLVYNGKPHSIEASLGNIAVGDSVNAVCEGISGTNAGSYTARAVSIDNPNYLLPQYSRSYVIGKALPRISAAQYRYEFVQDSLNSYSLQASASNGMPVHFFVAEGSRLIPISNAFGKDTGEYTVILTTEENNNFQAALPIEVIVVVLATSYTSNIAGQDATLSLSGGGQPNAEFIARIADFASLDANYLPVYRSKAVRYVCEAKLVEGNTVLDISNAEVRLKLPESLQNQQEITIMYNENGAIIYKTVAVNDGYIVFAMQELGEFALLDDKEFTASVKDDINGKFILSAINAVIITISVVLLIIVIRKKLYKT